MDESEVRDVFAHHGMSFRSIARVGGNSVRETFVVDGEFLLRCSASVLAMEHETEKLARVAAVPLVPTVEHTGSYESRTGTLEYAIHRLLPGKDLMEACPDLTRAEQRQIGQDLAGFLELLHAIPGRRYDIGHYVPTVANFVGSWLAGHRRYWEHLNAESRRLSIRPSGVTAVGRAFEYLKGAEDVLAHQAGPRLLHNDLHMKNIVVRDGRLAGVIDWECSQYGEADFDLSHLVHWCAFPPQADADFSPLLEGVFSREATCTRVPDLASRLTVYQLEHELNQLIWQDARDEKARTMRIRAWLDGMVGDLLAGWTR